jgi:hypothetical protein
MLAASGHFVHIDFGHILGHAKYAPNRRHLTHTRTGSQACALPPARARQLSEIRLRSGLLSAARLPEISLLSGA